MAKTSAEREIFDYSLAVELARSKSAKALRRLAELMDSEDERVALAACNSVLDRAWGKPTLAVEHSGKVEHYVAEVPALAEDSATWLQQVNSKHGVLNGSSSGDPPQFPKLDS